MKKLIIIFLSVLLIASVGCKKGYLDINTNPNSLTNGSAELVLPSALTITAGEQITGYAFISEWLGYWAPSGSYAISSSDIASYKQTTNFGNGIFITGYHNLEDYDFVEQQGKATKQPFYEATAKVMKAYVYQQLVDLFNNIPYSDALKNVGSIQPKYDDAKSIYESLALKLDTAVVLFKTASPISAGTSDALFHGDNSLWIQFANSLKLRILMRQTEVAGRTPYIQAGIDKIVANGGGFLATDAGVNPGFSAAQPSPFYAFNKNTAGTYINDYWRANAYTISFDKNNADPRYKFLYAPTSDSLPSQAYRGNVIGSATNHPGNDASTFGPGVVKAPNQDAILFTASESFFLQAEAALRGFLPGDPSALYKMGVQANFDYLGAGDATAYYSQPGNKQTTYEAANGFNEQLAVIIRQKWHAENMTTPFEAYADYRRLHLPSDIPLSSSPFVDVNQIPTRLLYPSSEYSTNAANVNAQGTIDYHTSKIFWMP